MKHFQQHLKQYPIMVLTGVIVIMMLALSGSLLAQTTAPTTPTEEAEATAEAIDPADCEGSGLTAARAEIDALLVDFEMQAAEDPSAALEALFIVSDAYRRLALDCGYLPENLEGFVIEITDIDRIIAALDTLDGDPLRGQLIYNGEERTASGNQTTCAGCHEIGDVAPPTAGTWTRWDEQHSLEPRFADYTFERYTIESIILPHEYLVEPFAPLMPDNYHELLGYQDLTDVIAYLNSQDQLLED